MIGCGTIINSISIVVGGGIGHFTGKLFNNSHLVWGKKLNVANMLPAVLLAILAAYLPWNF